jgi:hypothetical protein
MTEELLLRLWQERAEYAEDRLHCLEAALRKTDEVAKQGKVGENPTQHFNSIRRIARAALYRRGSARMVTKENDG